MLLIFCSIITIGILVGIYLVGSKIYNDANDNTKMAKWTLSLYKHFEKKSAKNNEVVQPQPINPVVQIDPIEESKKIVKLEEQKLKSLVEHFENSINSQNTIICSLIENKNTLSKEQELIESELPALIDAKSVNGVNRRTSRLNSIKNELLDLNKQIEERQNDINTLMSDKSTTETEFINKINNIKDTIEELEREKDLTSLQTKISDTKQKLNEFNSSGSLTRVEDVLNKELENVRIKKRLARNNILDNA